MAPKALTHLPSEIRQQIFRECLEVDGGYVYDVQTDKLTNADGTSTYPFFILVARSQLTPGRCHWQSILSDSQLSSVKTGELLEIALVDHERWTHENNDPEYFFQTATLLAKRPAVCSMVRQFLKTVDLFKINGASLNLEFGLLHRKADANSGSGLSDQRRPNWAQGELREATSYCLKLISEAQPDEFAAYVYDSLPHWIGSRPAEDFINLRFNLWDIPSQEQVAHMLELFEIGAFVWELPATWYYAPRSFYDQVGKGVPQDRRSPEFEKPDNLLEHFTSRCREKLRFSATAAAIRFLQRLPISQRMQIRKIVLHEDLPSVNLPSRHTQGLIPFLKENPLLRVERHASVLGCVLSQRPYNIIAHMDGDENMLPPAEMLDRDFEASIHYWLLNAFAVVDSGVNTSCFTFVLEAGQHSEYCADLFQKFIQTEISKSKAWKICLDTGLLASLRPWIRDNNAIRYAKDPRLEKLVDRLVNQTSSLRCDFNPGVLLDVDALVEDAKVRHGENILDKWVSKQDLGAITFPHDLYQDIMVAPNWEFQTRQEYIESRGMNTNAEDS
ncbi:hypothetical protein FCIRC_12084 [Fusarium circinatum]|uniref:Uncharacterized protein n=1 Tax=Fusarium circinatum TaxID=48490 RepID=A0A8H5WJU0_FUSCI|nr:hypothetical protein FCIRC_12084 [Fusarium circinatum]